MFIAATSIQKSQILIVYPKLGLTVIKMSAK